MATTVSLEKARATLRRHFGERLRTTEENGRQMLKDALVADLQIVPIEAGRLVEELESSGAIRWLESDANTMTSDDALVGGVFGTQGLPPAAASGLTHAEGFWQL